MQKIYKCECGREFTNPQQFNGHKSNCKVKLINTGKLEEYLQIKRRASEKSIKTLQINNKKKKQDALNTWVSEQHTCEKCRKIMTEKFGSGRYCSRQCSNSRAFSDEAKMKKSVANKGTKAISNGIVVKYIKTDEDIPDGFFPTSYFSKNAKRQSNKERLKSRKPSFNTLLAEHDTLVKEHNSAILKQYEQILAEKAQNKEFDLADRKVSMCGQYLTVKALDSDLSIEKIFRSDAIFVHTLVAEHLLGRAITKDEIVHHCNFCKLDNRFDNIYIFDSRSSHARFHVGKRMLLKIDGDRLICEKLTLESLMQLVDEHKVKNELENSEKSQCKN